MDFRPNPEQEAFRDSVRRFAQRHLAPGAREWALQRKQFDRLLREFQVQVMGGMGYSREAPVEYCLARCRCWMIAGGSIEILENRIAEGIFERSFPQRPQ